tara:strand:+ start:8696 stop:9085 length:390 start_codon:yes stop_codon:yes gene_type:complete
MKAQYIKIDRDGHKYYYSDKEMTQLHREDGPACEYVTGSKSWYLNGKCHREDGPAVECVDAYKDWYLNGIRHRENGPAVEYSNGNKDWFFNGKKVTQEEHALLTKKVPKININGKEFTLEELNNLIKRL